MRSASIPVGRQRLGADWLGVDVNIAARSWNAPPKAASWCRPDAGSGTQSELDALVSLPNGFANRYCQQLTAFPRLGDLSPQNRRDLPAADTPMTQKPNAS